MMRMDSDGCNTSIQCETSLGMPLRSCSEALALGGLLVECPSTFLTIVTIESPSFVTCYGKSIK